MDTWKNTSALELALPMRPECSQTQAPSPFTVFGRTGPVLISLSPPGLCLQAISFVTGPGFGHPKRDVKLQGTWSRMSRYTQLLLDFSIFTQHAKSFLEPKSCLAQAYFPKCGFKWNLICPFLILLYLTHSYGVRKQLLDIQENFPDISWHFKASFSFV